MPVPCQRERWDADLPSALHFRVDLRNLGRADVAAPDGSGAGLPLRFRILDDGVEVGTETLQVRVDTGAATSVLLSTAYNLTGRGGLRKVTVEVDIDDAVPEEDEANNAFSSADLVDPEDPRVIRVRAPDLVPSLEEVQFGPDNHIRGTFSILNRGDLAAGGNDPDLMCLSEEGARVRAALYLDAIASPNLVEILNYTLDPGQSLSQTFDIGPVTATEHELIVLANERGTVVDARPEDDVLSLLVPPPSNPPTNDTQSPSVAITLRNSLPVAPEVLPTIHGGFLALGTPAHVDVDATDNGSGVARVEFWVDGQLRGTDPVRPYAFDWYEPGPIPTVHVAEAVAYDAAGNVNRTALTNVTYVPVAGGCGPPFSEALCGIVGPIDPARLLGLLSGLLPDASALCRVFLDPESCPRAS